MKNYGFGLAFGVALTAGTIVGLVACDSPQEHGSSIFGGSGDDASIRKIFSRLWQANYPNSVFTPDISVSDGVVMLTGVLPTPQQRIDAVRDAWAPEGVREVVNEIQVPAEADPTYSKDTSYKMKLRARLTFDPDIDATNYSIDAFNGTLYLMGNAKSQEELDKVTRLAENVSGGKPVSYVAVKPPVRQE